ncbi:hypothetical protein AAG906_026484 [Vitis piasezkii]
MMLIRLLDMETTFDVGAPGMNILLKTYDIASPDDLRIRRLCTIVLEVIHEMDRLDVPFSNNATTQFQRGLCRREIMHTLVVVRIRLHLVLLLLHNSSLNREVRGTRHTYVLRDAPLADINLPPIKKTPITPMEVSSTLPIIPLVASPPRPIEATLVDEETEDDRSRGHGRRRDCQVHREVHVSPIEPIVEHAYHGRPQLKWKTPSCSTH